MGIPELVLGFRNMYHCNTTVVQWVAQALFQLTPATPVSKNLTNEEVKKKRRGMMNPAIPLATVFG